MQKTVKALTQTPWSLLLWAAAMLVILYKYTGGSFGVVVCLPKQALSLLAFGIATVAFRLTKRQVFVVPVADKEFSMRFMIVNFFSYGVVTLITAAFGLMIFVPQSDIFGVPAETVIRTCTVVGIVSFMAALLLGIMRSNLLKKYAQALPQA